VDPEARATHPVDEVTWYGAVAYCHYLSQMRGRTSCYRLDDWSCDWSVNGYRLPTEAEWEKAARGGRSGKRFPWGDVITHGLAAYDSSSSLPYDVSATRGYHPVYGAFSAPAGAFPPNAYGLHDMTGNVYEWCWDWYSSSYPTDPQVNPRGPVEGGSRIRRGGSWNDRAWFGRVADRDAWDPAGSDLGLGFRTVLQSR
jgi:formylglycine-generating enzyme required for sulfatase activity